jgi:hypothetical protein
MEVFDIIELKGQRYKIVGEGVDKKGKKHFNARPVDSKGNIVYKPGTLIQLGQLGAQ